MSVELLQQHGMHVSTVWLQQLQSYARRSLPGFSISSQAAQQELLWQHFMQQDLHAIGAQALPSGLQVQQPRSTMPCKLQCIRLLKACVYHRHGITGSYKACLYCKPTRSSTSQQQQSTGISSVRNLHMLQAASLSARPSSSVACRHEEAAEKRCLKLLLTDGIVKSFSADGGQQER